MTSATGQEALLPLQHSLLDGDPQGVVQMPPGCEVLRGGADVNGARVAGRAEVLQGPGVLARVEGRQVVALDDVAHGDRLVGEVHWQTESHDHLMVTMSN